MSTRPTHHSILAHAIEHLVAGGVMLTDANLAAWTKFPLLKVTDLLNQELAAVSAHLPSGTRLERVPPNQVAVRQVEVPPAGLVDGYTYRRRAGTREETVGGTVEGHPDWVWTQSGLLYERATGRRIATYVDQQAPDEFESPMDLDLATGRQHP